MNDDGILDSIANSFEDMIKQIFDFTPKLIAALIVLLVGIVIAKMFAKVVKRLVQMVEGRSVSKELLTTLGLKKSIGPFIGKIVYWVIVVIFLSAATDVLKLQALSSTVDSLLAFIPKLFSAVIIAGVTYLGARVLRDLVESALGHASKSLAKTSGTAVQVLVMVFGIVTALTQLGLDLSLINNNITAIVGGLALAFGLAFGLGGRKIAASFMTGVLDGDSIKKGQSVNLDDVSGTIKSVGRVSAVVETKKGDTIVSLGRIVR